VTTAQIVYWIIGCIAASIWLVTREEVTIASIIVGLPFAALVWPILALYLVISSCDRVVLWRKK
jgi:multisubunit Na+/H+ antiporter MnhE subunit